MKLYAVCLTATLAFTSNADARIIFNVEGPVPSERMYKAVDWDIIPDIKFECESMMTGERLNINVSHKDKSLYIVRGEAQEKVGAITKSMTTYEFAPDRFGRNTPVGAVYGVNGNGWYVSEGPQGWFLERLNQNYNCIPD